MDHPPEEKDPGRVSVKRLFIDFATWTTVACLPRIVEGGRVIAPIFALILIAMVIAFAYATTTCIIKFLKYPSTTELELQIQALQFPLISFCSENPMKRSIVDTDPVFAEISNMLAEYEALETNATDHDSNDIDGSDRSLHRMKRAQLTLRMMMARLSEADRRRAGYSYLDLVTECSFAGETCSSINFKSFLHPQYGLCYTFISDAEITRPGTSQQFRLLLTVNQDWPKPQPNQKERFDFLPTTDSAAVWAVVHQEGEFPDFYRNGFRVGVGTQAVVSLSRTDHHRLGQPYGNCIEQGEESDNYYKNYTYTMQTCQQSCLQRLAWKQCGCADPLFEMAPVHAHCTTAAAMECLLTLPRDITRPNTTEGRSLCECQPACEEALLDRVVSYTSFPAASYNVAAGTKQQRSLLLASQGGGRAGKGDDTSDDYDNTTTTTQSPSGRKKRDSSANTTTTKAPVVVDQPGFGSCEYANKNFKGATECIEWYRRNALLLQVHYERLRVSSYTQGATYDFLALVSDVSGHAGLWLGVSVVTMVEIVGFIIVCIHNFTCKKRLDEPFEEATPAKGSPAEEKAQEESSKKISTVSSLASEYSD